MRRTVQITVALSHERRPMRWWRRIAAALDSGLVHEVAAGTCRGRYQNVRAYLAGPPPAVDAAVRMLLQARVSTDNIRYDKFS